MCIDAVNQQPRRSRNTRRCPLVVSKHSPVALVGGKLARLFPPTQGRVHSFLGTRECQGIRRRSGQASADVKPFVGARTFGGDGGAPQESPRTGRVALSRRSFDRTAKASALVDYFRYVEPPHSYVHDASSSVVHHQDYLNGGSDQPLCGAAFEKPARLGPTIRPVTVCPDCVAKLAEYHVKWWREKAEEAAAELDGLRGKYRELAEYVDNQHRPVAGLQHPAPVMGDPSGEHPESRSEIDGEPQADATTEHGETTPTSLLDQARKELVELCRPFDEAVPYWRVKNSVDAFSDKLKSDERLLLAHEIGADGPFTRWCIREIEGLGWQVTNSPVNGDADDMMDAWAQDLYQPPKKTKWRLGRPRSHDGS